MFIRLKRTLLLLICGIFFFASLFLATCGLEEVYFLPQVPEANIKPVMNTSATLDLPKLNEDYAVCYKIFYRIYISLITQTGQIEESSLSSINTSLSSDYKFISPNTDPTDTSSGTPANTLFTRLNYFELALSGIDINKVLSKNGGNITISFPTEQGGYPVLRFNNTDYRIFRSKDLISPEPKGDRSFRNSSELNDPNKATSNINADVAGLKDSSPPRYAYVSMYIVAAGSNYQSFTPVYSKPTFINIFKLPEK